MADLIFSICPPSILCQILVGLSRTTILFIVTSGLSLILGVLRIPNVAHGSLYMIGAFMAFSVSKAFGGGATGFWMALFVAPLGVAIVSLIIERGVFSRLYEREHLMLLLLTFSFSLVFGDLVKMVWGGEYRTVPMPMPSRVLSRLRGSALPHLQYVPSHHGPPCCYRALVPHE